MTSDLSPLFGHENVTNRERYGFQEKIQNLFVIKIYFLTR